MGRIFIVEDDPGVGPFLKSLFSKQFEDDQFDVATDFRKAVEVLVAAKKEGKPVNGILSDFNYSGVEDGDRPNATGKGGFLLEHVKGDPQTKRDGRYPEISFAFMSGNIGGIKEMIESKGFWIGDDHILPKPPMNFDVFFKMVEHLKAESAMGGGPGEPRSRLLMRLEASVL